MKAIWRRRIFRGLSLTTAAFIFQACYGAPQDRNPDYFLEGVVKSKTTNQPIQGIKVIINSGQQFCMTDSVGYFSAYVEMQNSIMLGFRDVDSTGNGYYADKDTSAVVSGGEFFSVLLENR